jgi:hypothetical protein
MAWFPHFSSSFSSLQTELVDCLQSTLFHSPILSTATRIRPDRSSIASLSGVDIYSIWPQLVATDCNQPLFDVDAAPPRVEVAV